MLPIEFDGRTVSSYPPSTRRAAGTWNTWLYAARPRTRSCGILDAFAVPYPRMPVTGIAEDVGDFVADVTNARAVGSG